ncbi:TPA: hypothetical protein MH599_14945 [Klebsiella pneumoniae]|nr:hypothetical protein C3J88_20210 [Klebsiella pneumoniae subsp. pneumoniae]HBX1761978.1 hypothetical protein [Klebsiella pneumoniae subsp. pneumoniae]HBX6031418.1 hypothetical protein [Klebsiella pneumoniae]
MQVHESRTIKRAGVAGIRARGNSSITNVYRRWDRCLQSLFGRFLLDLNGCNCLLLWLSTNI